MTNSEEQDAYIEALGVIATESNLPRTAGRISALLQLSEVPLSFSAIEERLAISRGNVSANTRLLMQLGEIESVKTAGRESYFRYSTRPPYQEILKGQMDRNLRVVAMIDRIVEAACPTPVIRRRLLRNRMFLETANALMQCHLRLMMFEEAEASTGALEQET